MKSFFVLIKLKYQNLGRTTAMPNGAHRNPHYALRIPEETMDKLKYIAGHNGRSANKEIEQLILAHIAQYEEQHGKLVLTPEDYEFIRKRT